MPLLNGIGQFGSLRSPEPGAARYISTKINGNFRLIYKDFELLESQFEEDQEIEPKFFLPIIPTVLLNGSSGIAVGFATNILNRNPIDLIDACLKVLDGKSFQEPLPWWSDFNGIVEKVVGNESSFIIKGLWKVANTTTVEVSELPPSMTFRKYENHLNSLLEKGHISSYDDNCSKNINYVIKFNRAALQTRIEKDQLYNLLKMGEAETENLTCLDEKGKLIIFKNVSDLIRYFVKFRLGFYDKRKDFMLNELFDRNIYLSNRARFIKAIIDNKLKLSNRPKQDVIIDLQKMKFDQIGTSYDYLLTMAIQSITKEKYESLLKEVEDNQKEIERIKCTEPIDTYRSDLKDLRKKIFK